MDVAASTTRKQSEEKSYDEEGKSDGGLAVGSDSSQLEWPEGPAEPNPAVLERRRKDSDDNALAREVEALFKNPRYYKVPHQARELFMREMDRLTPQQCGRIVQGFAFRWGLGNDSIGFKQGYPEDALTAVCRYVKRRAKELTVEDMVVLLKSMRYQRSSDYRRADPHWRREQLYEEHHERQGPARLYLALRPDLQGKRREEAVDILARVIHNPGWPNVFAMMYHRVRRALAGATVHKQDVVRGYISSEPEAIKDIRKFERSLKQPVRSSLKAKSTKGTKEPLGWFLLRVAAKLSFRNQDD